MTLSQALTDLVTQATEAAGFTGQTVPSVVPTNNPEHGDFQSNLAMRLGRSVDEKVAAAEKIVANLPENGLVASCTVVKPGFINFRLTEAALARAVEAAAADARFGVPQRSGTLVIDFSSPNIAKRMHVGHLRSTVIGDAIHRIYEACGWTVIADNHLGDWGTQFGKLIVAWGLWRDDAAYEADAIAELQRIYQKFAVEAESDDTLNDRAREETAKLQSGDPTNLALWEQFVAASMREFDTIYDRMGVQFDVALGESAYRDELQDLVDELLANGIAEESRGAVVIPFTKADGKGLGDKPLLVRKSDGSALYGTTDLATIRHRKRTWNPDRVVYVVDTRQQDHFRQVFAGARKMGFDMHLEHVWFGMLKFPGGAVASTRAGATANLADVLDEAVARSRAVIDEKSAELSESEKAEIAEKVGVGTVKYFDLRQNPQSDITFDWDASLALNGNTAVYQMYQLARCRSILRRSGADVQVAGIVVTHPIERELLLALNRLSDVVSEAAETYRPNLVADQLYTIASTLGRFYGECHVLGTDEEASRLALIQATARALDFGLGLLGIDAPERM
ncbi:MAG: arginine--tRNA ligase [Myxococcota bacterium]